MTTLGYDCTMLILMHLGDWQIMQLCEKSSQMKKICSKEKYSNLWREKISQNFGIDYIGASFYEFRHLTELHDRCFYLLEISDTRASETDSYLFVTEKLALQKIKEWSLAGLIIREKSDKNHFIDGKFFIYTIKKIRLSDNNKTFPACSYK